MLETLLEALLLILVGALMIVSFLIGAKTAQKVDRGEKIELPTLNPMKAYKEFTEQREAKKEQEELDAILENINNYDGTPNGQKDIK